jgi:hypothetical protein
MSLESYYSRYSSQKMVWCLVNLASDILFSPEAKKLLRSRELVQFIELLVGYSDKWGLFYLAQG